MCDPVAHPLKKSESKREEPKLGEPKLVQPDDVAEISIAQELAGERVADTLIRARQQLGQDLRSIANVLCIRYSYLDAIERGQFENRSEEHTSELQSLMRISYSVFCLKKKTQ